MSKLNFSKGFFLAAAVAVAGCNAPQPYTGQTFAQTPALPSVPAAGNLGAEMDLVGLLVGQLGISPQQALGGVGSIFSLAQQRLNPGDFSLLSSNVPNMDRYLGAVSNQPKFGDDGGSSLLGTAGGLLGLAGSFQSLGMNSSMIGQFVPVVLQYVQNQGGASAMALLEQALYR
ncbi:DUF2780 domain-containing protein [Methylomonas sp. MED-D]|uniref:DUF2780 domain-containing protein n=1 Tax=unclassified Methylomonas TaxID=2608980 RepID=UPI0009F2B76C|nr:MULTISPECIES: DUF2780 domain-containing protein [unclassified Methylomonas]MDT4330941.1 DUF2780 domain-containing protein [Methylomonas sp. MV1]